MNRLCLITALLLAPSCESFASFAASSVNIRNPQNLLTPNVFKGWKRLTVKHTIANNATAADNRWSFPSLRKRSFEFPALDQAYSQIEDTHSRYLKRHQIVKKRRVFKRIIELQSILNGQILRPLLCSIAKTKPDLTQLPAMLEEGNWDEFWRESRGKSKLTNAERVARGVPVMGPTFVKVAQILATRPDILPLPLAEALGSLQDNLPPFDNLTAKRMIRTDIKKAMEKEEFWSDYIQSKEDLNQFMDSLSKDPVAAGSVAQVYRGDLPGYGPVAIKVLRPGIRAKVERDATLFHSVATWVEKWNNNTLKLPLARQLQLKKPLGSLQVVSAVDEFTSRVLEDMDFTREAENMKVFAQLYCNRVGTSPTVQVVVPEVIPELCSQRVLVMEWIEGTKLTDVCSDCATKSQEVQENLELIVQAIEMTVSQLIDHGLLHGDPHSANLLKVKRSGSGTKPELGYLDFGVVSAIPQKFRDGIVIAVVQLVFARNIEAVADLCGDLGLLNYEVLQDAGERKRFLQALEKAIDQVLIWPKCDKGVSTAVPTVRFENLLPAFTPLIQGFAFTLPPYFLNNVRALATLEGIALKLDPNFNVLRVIYPYSINRLMRNPNVSKKVQETFVEICRSPTTKLISPRRVKMLLTDWAMWTGYRKRRIAWDLATSAGGRRVTPALVKNWYLNRLQNLRSFATNTKQTVVYACNKVLRAISLKEKEQPLSFLKEAAVL